MPKAVCNAYMVFCIGAGSAVNLASGTSAPIEEVEASSRVLARHEHGLASRRVTDVLHRGHRECVELLFDDGRNLVCTPDHRILAAAGPHDAPETRATWTKASDLIVNKSYVSVGVEYPLHERAEDAERCVAWALRLDELDLTLNFTETRSQTMAFARLLGYATSSRAVLQDDSCDLTFDHQLDADCAVADMQLLTGVAPVCSSPDEDHQSFRVTLPSGLLHAFRGVSSDIGDRRHQSTHLPSLLLASECPLPFIREFLGGLFGGAGTALSLSQDAHNLSGLALRTTKQGTVAQAQHGLVQLELCPLLARVGIDTNELALSCSADMADLRDDTSYDVNLSFGAASVMPFARRIGFRFRSGVSALLRACVRLHVLCTLVSHLLSVMSFLLLFSAAVASSRVWPLRPRSTAVARPPTGHARSRTCSPSGVLRTSSANSTVCTSRRSSARVILLPRVIPPWCRRLRSSVSSPTLSCRCSA